MTRHPILVGLSPAIVTGLILAIANLANAFGWADITPSQLEAINSLATTLLVVFGVGGIGYAQNKSTPVDSPVLKEGQQVEVVTPPGEANRVVTL